MNLSPVFRQRFFDQNGLPLAGGQLFSYIAGTTTPQVTYSNQSGTTNANPVVLDAFGYADVWLDPTLSYKFVLEDSLGNVQWTVDQIIPLSVGLTTWSANTTYQQGNLVLDSSGYGLIYVSLTNNNTNNALTSNSNWRLLGGSVRTLSSNTTLVVTDGLVRSNSTSGNLTFTLPPISTSPIGLILTIKDVGTGGNTTSVKGSGSDLVDGNNTYANSLSQYGFLTVENNGTSWDVIAVFFAANSVITSSIADGAVTQAKLATRSTGTTVAAGGVAVSTTTGTGTSYTLTAFTAVTNLSVMITTTGRPVKLALQNSPASAPGGCIFVTNGTSGDIADVTVAFLRSGTFIGNERIIGTSGSATAPTTVPSSSVNFLDITPAGTYTYTVEVSVAGSGSPSCNFNNVVLVAYET